MTGLGDGSLQNEWTPGRMGAQNGNLELGQFELDHFSTLYTNINYYTPIIINYAKQKFNFSKKQIAQDYILTRINTRASVYILFMFEHTDKQTNEQT